MKKTIILMLVSVFVLSFTFNALAVTKNNVVLLGPPASGKGTQAKFIGEKLGIPKISTGDLLRNEIKSDSKIGKKIKEDMKSGKLVSDEIVISILKQRISQDDCKDGFLLDGFPRNLSQAKYLKESGVDINLVVELQVSDESIIKRITGRRVHPASGRTYHVDYNPPKVANKDDVTGEDLTQREDDTVEAAKNRIALYYKNIGPVISWYKDTSKESNINYVAVDGNKSINEVKEEVLIKIKN